MNKVCLKCGKSFEKPRNRSVKDFLSRAKFCSLKCVLKTGWFVKGHRGYFKGLKFTEEHKRKIGLANSIILKDGKLNGT